MIKKEVINKIVDSVSVYDIVKEDVSLKRAGSDYIGLCPFHNDHNPSFRVSPGKNICKCFVCGEGGSPITYYMKKHGCEFIQAIREIAPKVHIEIEEEEESKEARIQRERRESLCSLNKRVFDFYKKQLNKHPDIIDYLEKRLGKDFMENVEVGFAPNINKSLFKWATDNHENCDYLLELGWLTTNREGWMEDKLYNRIIFPIYDAYSMMVGYTARTTSKETQTLDHCKYINTPDCYVYHKADNVFGLDAAKMEARKQNKLYLVEGAFDALKMRCVGINNVVAALGGEWTDNMLKLVNRYADTICFINDADPAGSGKNWGPGIDFVLKNGAKAVKRGLNVTVKELATLPGNEKQDPGSYFTSKARLNDLLEQDFIIWYAKKHFSISKTDPHIKSVMHDVTDLLACIPDEVDVEYTLKELNNIYKGKGLWKKYLSSAQSKRSEKDGAKK